MNELGSWLALSLIAYMLFQIAIVGFMAQTGRQVLPLFSAAITTIYLFGTHAVLLFGPINIDIPVEFLLISIIVLSLPQFAMYLWKISSKNEFRYPIAKLLIRLTFVHGYLSAVLLTRYEPVIGITVIVGTATLFAVVRELSSPNVSSDHSVCTNSVRNNKIITPASAKSVKLKRTDAILAVSFYAPPRHQEPSCCECCAVGACCIGPSYLCCGG